MDEINNGGTQDFWTWKQGRVAWEGQRRRTETAVEAGTAGASVMLIALYLQHRALAPAGGVAFAAAPSRLAPALLAVAAAACAGCAAGSHEHRSACRRLKHGVDAFVAQRRALEVVPRTNGLGHLHCVLCAHKRRSLRLLVVLLLRWRLLLLLPRRFVSQIALTPNQQDGNMRPTNPPDLLGPLVLGILQAIRRVERKGNQHDVSGSIRQRPQALAGRKRKGGGGDWSSSARVGSSRGYRAPTWPHHVPNHTPCPSNPSARSLRTSYSSCPAVSHSASWIGFPSSLISAT